MLRSKSRDEDGCIDFGMRADDGEVELRLKAEETQEFPAGSVFSSLTEASEFFRTGSTGYSRSKKGRDYDGMVLDTEVWEITPLRVDEVYSSYFSAFGPGTAEFDSAFLMRDIPHHWTPLPKLTVCADASCMAA